jgi:predicted nucleotidyltransferase
MAESDRTTVDTPGLIDAMAARIVRMFHPYMVVLFGSHARGTAGPDSDVDFLIIMDVPGTRRAARLAIYRALADRPLPVDVVVATPDDVRRRRDLPGTILYPALREGRVLYERM